MSNKACCWSIALCLALGLSACSGDDGNNEGDEKMDTGQPEPDVAADTVEPDSGMPPEDVGEDVESDVEQGPRFEELSTCPGTVAQTVTVGTGNVYDPADATIAPGEVVKWSWDGGTHNVRADNDADCESARPDWFASDTLQGRGNTYCVQFNETGTWNYQCTVTGHCRDGMKGTITVEAQ
jgi:plastocyanin